MGLRHFFIIVLLFLFVCCSPKTNASEIDAKQRAQDARLETPVTLHERRIYLGELFAKLRTQTGIELSIDETLSLSGVQVSLHCTRLPVVTLLNSLWSLLSNREAEWTWLRLSEAGKYRYEFTQTAQAREKAARFGGYAQRVFEQYVAVMEEFARMTPKERKRNISRLSKALFQSDNQVAQSLIGDDSIWKFVQLFAEGVPPDVQRQIFTTRGKAKIFLTELPGPLQELFHQVYAECHFSYHQNGVEVPLPKPTTLHFFSSNQNLTRREIVPSIMLDFGPAGSYSSLGNYDVIKGIKAYLKQLWILPGDTPDHPLAQKVVPEEKSVDPASVPLVPFFTDATGRKRHSALPQALDTWLLLLARSAAIPMIEILPFQQNDDPGSPINKTVAEFLSKAAQNDPSPMHKWRDGVLLVNSPAWFLEEENTVPYRLVKELTKWRGQLIPLAQLAALMNTLTEAQAQSLADEYPPIAGALQFYPAFRLCAQSPELLTDAGIKLDAEKIAVLLTLPLSHPETLKAGTAGAVRLVQKNRRFVGRERFLEIQLEAQVGEGWELLGGFYQNTN